MIKPVIAIIVSLSLTAAGYSWSIKYPVSPSSSVAGFAQSSTVDWVLYGDAAKTFVNKETPAEALPYVPAVPGDSERLVIAHYFPPFPISIDGAAPAHDYYATGYLDPGGEGGKHHDVGGYLRVRPLPAEIPSGYDYRRFHLAVEVARAARIGVDAFGVDLLTIDPQNHLWQTSLDLLEAAKAVSPAFKIIPEPDMTAIGDAITPEQLADALATFSRHPAAFHTHGGRLLVMPFAAEAKPAAWWLDLQRRTAARGVPIALVPVFVDRALLPSFAPFAVGASIWGDRYASADLANTRSAQAAKSFGIKQWIMPVAFQDYRPKDRLLAESHNSEGWRRQWQSAIQTQSKGVHLITWNDYSETTQISPTVPGGFGIYDLSGYYIAWFKRGAPPLITRDALYLVYRPQVLYLNDGAGSPLRVDGPTALVNDVEAISLLRSPATLTLRIGRSAAVADQPKGLSTMRVNAVAGRPDVTLARPGIPPIRLSGSVVIANKSAIQDATYHGESLLRKSR